MSGNVMNAVLCAVIAITIPGMVAQPFLLYDPLNEDEWTIKLIDMGQTRVAASNSIAVDSNGFPHISYSDEDGNNIKYARWTGTTWITKFVDNSSGGRNSIDLDSKDNPHIVQTSDNLRYAWWNGTKWNISILDNSKVHNAVEIAIDGKDNPHIVYIHDQSELTYLYWDGGEWVSEVVMPQMGGHGACLALDDNDIPHLAFYKSNRLHYATLYAGKWFIEAPDPTTHVGHNYCSIAIDSHGFPHISYYASKDENLMYTQWDAGNWLVEAVDTDKVYRASSLALSKDDYPRISYRGAGHLKFAEWTGKEWKIEDLGLMRLGTALALDSSGNPHISFQRYQSLYYATKTMQQQPSELALGIDPDTLNLKSEGRWITAYLRGENVEDIDASSLLLNDMISPAWWDVQNNTTLVAKFSRSFVQVILPVGDEVDVKVTGRWNDGQDFELHDTIRVIDPGPHKESPTSIFSRDRSLGYSRSYSYVLAPVREPEEGPRVWLRT